MDLNEAWRGSGIFVLPCKLSFRENLSSYVFLYLARF